MLNAFDSELLWQHIQKEGTPLLNVPHDLTKEVPVLLFNYLNCFKA